MITEIRHRYTNAVLWIGEAESLRDAVAKAGQARAMEDLKRCAAEDPEASS
jgi:hypothetical protein